ncbi:MAG: hypothetical protein U0641_08135 [Anaerolineae bacterium]
MAGRGRGAFERSRPTSGRGRFSKLQAMDRVNQRLDVLNGVKRPGP